MGVVLNGLVTRVQREAALLVPYYQSAGFSPNTAFLVAICAMTATVGRVSAPLYAWLANHGYPTPTGGTDPAVAENTVEVLPGNVAAIEAGICGGSEAVMRTIVSMCGLQTRKIDIFESTGGNHTFMEVLYGPGWHAFDPTFAQYWPRPGSTPDDAMSAVDIAASDVGLMKSIRICDMSEAWLQTTKIAHAEQGNGLDWFAVPHYTVSVDNQNGTHTTLFSK